MSHPGESGVCVVTDIHQQTSDLGSVKGGETFYTVICIDSNGVEGSQVENPPVLSRTSESGGLLQGSVSPDCFQYLLGEFGQSLTGLVKV